MMRVACRIGRRISDAASRTTSRAGRCTPRRQGPVLPQTAEGVLHVDDGVVHQCPDGDGHPAQSHGVDRDAGQMQGHHGGAERERDGEDRDGRRAEIAQERQQHEEDQDRAVPEGGHDVGDGDGDEIRLAEDAAVQHHAVGQGSLDPVELVIESGREVERVDIRLALNAQYYRRPAVHRCGPEAWARAGPDLCHITEQHRGSPVPRHHRGGEVLDAPHRPRSRGSRRPGRRARTCRPRPGPRRLPPHAPRPRA
jgi:hypothetical protein